MNDLLKEGLSKNVKEYISLYNHTIMVSGLCRYNGDVHSFYGFTAHYSPKKGYPTRLMLESTDEAIYYHVWTDDCEIIYCAQNTEPKYPINLN